MIEPALADLRAFAAVAEHRSFRAAADVIGVSRSALSHAVRGLEGTLGVRLLNRTTRSVSTTEAGERLLRSLRPIFGELAQALDAVSEDRGHPRGTLRINANQAGARLLLQTIPAFLARHPDAAVDLVVEGRLIDIVEHGFDAGVRLAEAVPRDMVAVPIGPDVRFVPVAAPAYLAGVDPPTVPDDLRHHRCIRQRVPSGKAYRWEFERHGQELAIDVPGALILNDTSLMIEAAAGGLGIAFVPETAAERWLIDGRLVVLLAEWCPPVAGLCLYYSRQRHVSAPLRAFLDMLKADRALARSGG